MPALVSVSAGFVTIIREDVLTTGQDALGTVEDGKEQCAAEDVGIQQPAALAATGLLGPPGKNEGNARPSRRKVVPNRYAMEVVDEHVEDVDSPVTICEGGEDVLGGVELVEVGKRVAALPAGGKQPAKKRQKRAGHGEKMESTDKNMITRMAGERPGFCTETKMALLALAAKNKTHPPTTMAGSGMKLLQQRVFGLCTEFGIEHDQVCLFTDLLANTMLQPADQQLEFLRGHNAAVRVLMFLHTPVVYPGRAAQDLNTDTEEKSSTWHTIHGMVRD